MSLQTRLTDFVTAVATDIKSLRTTVSGDATGGLTGLTTTAKTSIVSAINEVNGKAAPAPPAGSETVAGVLTISTQAEVDAGLVDTDAISPLKLQTRLVAYAQAKSANLTALDFASTAYGRGFLSLVNQAGLVGLLPTSSDTVVGVSRNGTQVEVNAGTLDTVAVTPLKFQTRLAAYAQPLSANLNSLSGQASTTYGRALLAVVDQAGLTGLIASATTLVSGISRFGTQAEVDAGTLATVSVSPLTYQTRLAAYAQPLSTNLNSLSGVVSTAYGRGFLTLVDQAGLMGLVRTASEAVTGVARFATQVETNAGTLDTIVVTPLKFQTRLAAYAQPLSTNLNALAGIVSGSTGQSLLQATTPAAAKTTLGLATIATSGSASDIIGGTLPSSVMPPLAITDVFVVATQVAQLALVAQRGDVAKRTDNGRTYILSTDDPTLMANWVEVTGSGDVLSVAGRIGAVTLTKADVALGNVDNTSDAAKPVSTAQQAALDLRLLKTANLSDVAAPATALTNLGGISSAAIGNPETDLVAAYATAKA